MHLKLDQKPVKMELDTGAAVSVMSEQQWKTLFTESKPLRPYEGNHYGVFRTWGAHNRPSHSRCVIWKPKKRTFITHCGWWAKTRTLLGRDWLHSNLSWIGLNCTISEKDHQWILSTNFWLCSGTIKGYKADIWLKEVAKPIFKSLCTATNFRSGTGQNEKEGISEPVENSEWATSLVLPKVNGN